MICSLCSKNKDMEPLFHFAVTLRDPGGEDVNCHFCDACLVICRTCFSSIKQVGITKDSPESELAS